MSTRSRALLVLLLFSVCGFYRWMVDPFTCTVGAFIVAQCVGFIGGRSGAFTCCVGAFAVAQCVGCV